MDKHKYFVIYRDNEQFEIIEAKDIVGCVLEFAQFMGKASLLMLKALKVCETAEECCTMYNRFVEWYDEIDAVYEIEDPMFQKGETE